VNVDLAKFEKLYFFLLNLFTFDQQMHIFG